MKKLISALVLTVVSSISLSAGADDGFSPYTLDGYSNDEACSLYVDGIVNDMAGEKYAQVRTSFESEQQIYVTVNRYQPDELISVDINGERTRKLTIRLPKRASVQSLHRALSYKVWLGGDAWIFQVCKGLKLQTAAD
jgi:hypothetical protein